MVVGLSMRQAVVMVLSVVMLIMGVVLVVKIMQLQEVLPPLPSPEEKVFVEVSPVSSQQGTHFLIKAEYPEKREQQDLRLIIEKGEYVKSINFYDDGKHYDEEMGDGVYGGVFNSEGRSLGRYEVKKYEEGEALTSFVVHESGCELIEGEAGSEKINFVILPSGYRDYKEFKADAEELISGEDSLIKVEPYKSNKYRFSFSLVNTSRDFECKKGCYNVSTIVCCNNKAVLEEASRCHYDSIIVLFKSRELCGSASYYAKLCSKNALSNLVLLHETGHSFADLADEYTYEDYFDYDIGKINAVNCAEKGCEKWKNITEGCYKGCTYSSLYRPAEKNSIMYTFVPVFNLVSQKHIQDLILDYVYGASEIEKASPDQKSYFVNLNYSQGKIDIGDVFLKPVTSGIDFKKSNYKVEITGRDGSLYKTGLYVPDRIFPLPNSSAKMIVQNNLSFSVMLPYFDDADSLFVYKNDEKVAEKSLALFSKTCGNDICEGAENHLSCPVDCVIMDGFCETRGCDPDCPSQENCESNKKTWLIFSIAIIILSLLLIAIIIFSRRK